MHITILDPFQVKLLRNKYGGVVMSMCIRILRCVNKSKGQVVHVGKLCN